MTKHLEILVVDDDPAIPRLFRDLISRETNAAIDAAPDGATALEMLREKDYEIAAIDMKMPGMDGMTLLGEIKKIRPETEVIMVTGHGSIEDAVQAMRLGAVDYVTKPFKVSQIMVVVDRVRKIRGLRDENRMLKEQLQEKYRSTNLIGMTASMARINEIIGRVKDEECNILVTGESGTGKELIARAIHYDGVRRDGPFVTVDCASIHGNLLESELFGHEKGSFTGAYAKKVGLLAKANRGTVFLDEIGELPIDLQPPFLRCLEERKVRPVGGTTMTDIDVRIVAATNRDLDGMAERGEFRRDLYYRLNVVVINVPPLRERKDDIPLLARAFIEKYNKARKKAIDGIEADALHMLLRYDWPGNVRELDHVIERAFALGKGERLAVDDLPPTIIEYSRKKGAPGPDPVAVRSLEEAETAIILRTLEENGFDTSRTAKVLKIDRSTIYRKLKRSNLSPSKLSRTR